MSGWAGSTRRARLPLDWPHIRLAVLDRDAHACTWMTDGARCHEPAHEVDHIRRGDDHRQSNLRALCTWHHLRKSGSEGGSAQHVSLRHEREKPPGLL